MLTRPSPTALQSSAPPTVSILTDVRRVAATFDGAAVGVADDHLDIERSAPGRDHNYLIAAYAEAAVGDGARGRLA